MLCKKYANVYKLLVGRVTTNIADSLFYMAVLWYFKETGHSPFMVAVLLTVTSGVDMVSFGLGPLIDRISMKKLLNYSTIIQAAISAAVVGVLQLGQGGVGADAVVLILYTASTVLSTIIYPAETKLLPLFVAEKDMLHFNGLFQVTYGVLDLVLDGFATFLIATTSISMTVVISGVVFALALLTYGRLQINALAKDVLESEEYFTGSYWKDLHVGWQTLKDEKNILELILPLCVVNFFYGIFDVGLPYFGQSYVHDSAIGYGGLLMASSLGGIVGAFLVQHFKLGKKSMELFIAICFVGAGVFRLLVPLTAGLSVLLILLNSAVSSLWLTMMNTDFEALVQVSFSSAVLGRIETINDSILSVMIPLGTMAGGLVVDRLGAISTQYIYGVTLLLAAVYYLGVVRHKAKK
ncbi:MULTISPECIES: MFS transporter [unclassified Lactobacillus]|uniref:MFS transporter n=1 Tax=unclassified Lactobacillus TaxID=2620435 RepID=UPI0018DECB8D|nr:MULTISPECIES: MFS transporter [unclassified Lactobacillus]MBH9990203.1 MFS transporter [Lactobacillus sp. M0392]MBI0024466.1 MFS transporter [Lactobacillus sp. W8171]MBI0045109.1 MFS transporter [Lactobacillus sp. M0393]